MASFVKRGKTWTYIVSNKGKPIRKGGFRTKKEAEVAANEVESQLNKGITPQLKLIPFSEYFKKWLSIYKVGIGDNTRARYEVTLNTIEEFFGDKAIQHITIRDYQKLLNDYGKEYPPESKIKQRSIETSRKLNS